MPYFFARLIVLVAGCTLLLLGCADRSRYAHVDGPAKPAVVQVEPWDDQPNNGLMLRSDSYVIYTTIDPEDDLVHALPQVMEGALDQYRKLAPTAPATERPLQCYVFGRRSEWEAFTRRQTGAVANVYLRITRGGYAVGDRFVAYDLGDDATVAVAAHEGWHQFSARHFKSRLPPFLEEGLACTFENLDWYGLLPRWNTRYNQKRVMGLRRALERRQWFDLEELIELHAGQIVNRPSERIEAFYAQSWAFARFLLEGDGSAYRPAFDRLIHDAVDGKIQSAAGRVDTSDWSPSMSRPILEFYLGMPLDQIDRRYREFARWVAFKEFASHWEE